MTDIKDNSEFQQLLDKDTNKIPQVGDTVMGIVLSASKAEVRLDIDGILTGVIRGQELYEEGEEYANLKVGDEIEATVVEEENENGELELSFRFAGQEKAMATLKDAFENKKNIKVKIVAANKGGLLASFAQIPGFLPVSQLAPENYPRVSGGDKSKILDKLKSFVGKEFEVKVANLDEKEEKIIFSEKDAWNELQKDIISKYNVGSVVEGTITAVTDFGVFVNFGENLEGLIHISELAWQRIDDPADLYKVGDTIKAEIINIDKSKIFLSAKKLMKDPWENVGEKYKVGQVVEGTILKVNPFGLFVKLDDAIHGLAHTSQLNLAPGQKIPDIFRSNDVINFVIVSIEPKDHRLGLTVAKEGEKAKKVQTPAEGAVRGSGSPVGKEKAAEKKAEVKAEAKKGEEKEEKKEKKAKTEKVEKKEKKEKKIVKAKK